MYWGGIGLQVANVDGGTGARRLAGGGQVVTGVAVAASSQVVYYADDFANRIGRVPTGGGNENSLISGLPAPPTRGCSGRSTRVYLLGQMAT